MPKIRKSRYFVGDFETTVFEGQEATEVWASACVELFSNDVKIFHSIEEQFNYFLSLKCNIICYYHNLEFDGNFWLFYLLQVLGYKQASRITGPLADDHEWIKPGEMRYNTVAYSISDLGEWYRVVIRVPGGYYIELRDSYKLLPFSVSNLARAFKTSCQKLEMDYIGKRFAGCKILPEEEEYIKNDVIIVKECLENMIKNGNNRLTIGSCCLAEYRQIIGRYRYNQLHPDIYQMELDLEKYGYPNAGEWVRQAYRGGWCYVARGKEGKTYYNGITLDVNSLYPSMMHSESGNVYPIGLPTFWSGSKIPDIALSPTKFTFIRIRTRFFLKTGKLPFVQVKSSLMYRPTQMLETSDIYDEERKKYYGEYVDFDGKIKKSKVTLTLTLPEFQLLTEHYYLEELEILDGCYFDAKIGLFDQYINKYKKIKLENSGAIRTLAKLFLNNLYGKMASSPDAAYRVAYIRDDGSLGYYTVGGSGKSPGYIPIGAAITSYSRIFTIRAAQQNYYGEDKKGFIYADTDSIHCDLGVDELRGVKLHDTNFCHWKIEKEWQEAIYVRPKTYIMKLLGEEEESYKITCAGMTQKSKDLLVRSIRGDKTDTGDKYNDQELEFLSKKRNMSDFKIGLEVPGKLRPKRIPGGVVLVDTPFVIR